MDGLIGLAEVGLGLALREPGLFFGQCRPHRLPEARRRAGQQGQQHEQPRQHWPFVPPREFDEAVRRRRRARLNRFVRQVARHVPGQVVGRLVASAAILLQALHHDPVQLTAEQLAQQSRITLPVG